MTHECAVCGATLPERNMAELSIGWVCYARKACIARLRKAARRIRDEEAAR